MRLTGRVDEIDIQMDKIQRLIEGGIRLDPELGAGLATTEDMSSIQKKIDESAGACEALDRRIRRLRS